MGPFPIIIEGNKIRVPGMDLRAGHTRFRRVILDGNVPVTMPIGFSISSPENPAPTTAIERNLSCQEATVAIAANVSGIIFVGAEDNLVVSEEQKGVISTNTVVWKNRGRTGCFPINQDKYLFTASSPVSVRFWVHQNVGFCSMATNAKFIHDSTFFPLHTVHTLIDYVRVLPLSSDCIEVRYLDGMTAELFDRIWNDK